MPKRMALTVQQRYEAVMSLLRREEPAAVMFALPGLAGPDKIVLWREPFVMHALCRPRSSAG